MLIIRKAILGIIVAVILAGWYSYQYAYNRVVNAFTIDTASETTEKSASTLINTKQKYNFGLVNTSEKALKLLKIELQDFQGIVIGDLTIDGKPFTVQVIPSHRVYTSSDTWTTNKRVMVDYDVEIKESLIQNPKSVVITYSYLGIEHLQTIKRPIIR